MGRIFLCLSAIGVACVQPALAQRAPTLPLTVELETTLDFAVAAHDGRGNGGMITIDPQTGERRVQGLIDLGGAALRGVVRLTGTPFARVSISIPNRATLTAADGTVAEVQNLSISSPPDATLDAFGQLAVPFGGRVIVRRDAAGEFRGRITVTANYR